MENKLEYFGHIAHSTFILHLICLSDGQRATKASFLCLSEADNMTFTATSHCDWKTVQVRKD